MTRSPETLDALRQRARVLVGIDRTLRDVDGLARRLAPGLWAGSRMDWPEARADLRKIAGDVLREAGRL